MQRNPICILTVLVVVLLVGVSRKAAASDLTDAVKKQSAFQAERCLRHGADPNELLEGEPLLVHAARNGNFELCRVLLLHGADANVSVNLGDAFLTLQPTDDRDELALQLLLRTYRFVQKNARAPNRQPPTRPGLVLLAEPTVDFSNPQIEPHYFVNTAERDGKSGLDDDDDGFVDNVYGWGMVADRPHEINQWQRQLFVNDAALIRELVEMRNRTRRGELSVLDPSYIKLYSSFRNPVAALFGSSYGFTDAKFLDRIVELSHGSHVAGIVLDASGGKAQLHTLSWENFGPYSAEVLGYPSVTDGDPEKWLAAVRQHRFARLIAVGQRCSDYVRAMNSSVVNASFHVSFETKVDRALDAVDDMRYFQPNLPTDTVTLLTNELFAYEMIPYLVVVAENPHVLFVAAAGNNRQNVDASFDAPAFLSRLFPNVISVAAVGENDRLASFSNFGRKSINIAAPGEDIESFGIAGTRIIMSGTSMAAPVVAGFAAAHRVRHPDCDAGQLVRLIELGATRPQGQQVFDVAAGGMLNPVQVSALNEGNADALVELAWRLIESNPERRPEVWADAVELYETITKTQLENLPLQWAAAVIFDQVEMGREALSAIDRAIGLDKTCPELWFSKCLILSRLKESKELLKTVEDFEAQFDEDRSDRTTTFRRDIMALGIATAIENQTTDNLDDWNSIYRSAVDTIGRAEGVGVPVMNADGSQVMGQLQSARMPRDESAIVHQYLLRCDGQNAIQVDLRCDLFDCLLTVTSPGDMVTSNDDFEGQLRHSQIIIDQPETGDYVVTVASVGGRETGQYVLDSRGATLVNIDENIVGEKQHRQ